MLAKFALYDERLKWTWRFICTFCDSEVKCIAGRGGEVGEGQSEAAEKVKTCYCDRSDRTWKAASSNAVHVIIIDTAGDVILLGQSSADLGHGLGGIGDATETEHVR